MTLKLDGGDAVEDMQEIKELLREIRDLKKAHFERYTEFTQSVLNRQQAVTEDAKRSQEENRRYRDEMRRAAYEGQQQVTEASVTRWVLLAVTITIGVFSVGAGIVTFGLGLIQTLL
jgi:hypothetical protein